VAAILTGMVTPPSSVPPPRRDSRRFTIPTPAALRHPRERPTEDPEQETAPADASAPADAAGLPDAAGSPEPLALVPPAPAHPAPAAPAEQPTHLTAHAGTRGSGRTPPTPATLPRPGQRPAKDSVPAKDAAPGPVPAPDEGVAGQEVAQSTRRMFPNPATLMAAGRGARKARPGGLRARRLPRVEETSAGGVVLDLASTPPAVALIARHDRRSRLLWSLPKGHVEEGETPEEAALREVLEETGLVGRIVAPLGVIDFWFVVEDKRIHKTVHHFVIEAIGGELSDEDLEVEAVEWIPFDQVVRKLAYGDERRLVEKVAQIVPGVR
jgi:ADP-ribose pyrophosphatase YjhB (NUDIX family)